MKEVEYSQLKTRTRILGEPKKEIKERLLEVMKSRN